MSGPRPVVVVEEGGWPGAPAGADTAGAVADRASEWAGAVAAHLGRPVPETVGVVLHPSPGVAWTQGTTVHLYQGTDGGVDLGQLPHELVHVVAGMSPSRFLSEGLAVHVAARVGLGAPCWPCYRLAPELWLAHLRRRRALPALEELIGEAQPLRLRDGGLGPEARRRAWELYVVAGAFTGFLFETMERTRFWAGYSAGAAWRDGTELVVLRDRWLRWLPAGLDDAAAALLAASLDDSRRELEAAR